jgi:hypothetical protein
LAWSFAVRAVIAMPPARVSRSCLAARRSSTRFATEGAIFPTTIHVCISDWARALRWIASPSNGREERCRC